MKTEVDITPADPLPPFDVEREAKQPFALSLRQVWHALRRVGRSVMTDPVDSAAASVPFYALLGLVPALAGAVSTYGLMADPADAVQLSRMFRGVLPHEVHVLVTEQLERISVANDGALTLGVVAAILFSLWSANRATKALFRGLNIAYGETESRNIFALNAVSLLGTAGLFVAAVATIGALAFLPAGPDGNEPTPWLVEWLRPSALGFGMLATLSVAYRYGPSRRNARWQWISVGSVLASVAWVSASMAFATYVENFGRYNETFGTLGAVIVLMTWLWLSAFIILLGAQLNAELEHATLRDTTVGAPKPLGERGAFMADDVPQSARDRLE